MKAPSKRGTTEAGPSNGASVPPQIKQAAILRNRAVALLRAGQKDNAQALLEEAIQVFPGFAEAEIRIGNIRRDQGDAKAAMDRYHRALTIKPGYAWAHLELAICLQRHKQPGQALDHYRQAVKHNPKLYKTVLFAMVDQPQGRFWIDAEALKRQLLGSDHDGAADRTTTRDSQ